MNNNYRVKNLVIGILCCGIIIMSVGYATLSSLLTINGETVVKSKSWDVHCSNISNEVATGYTRIVKSPTVDNLSTTINYSVILNQPGDSYSFSVNVTNSGSIDAKLSSIVLSGVNETEDKYLNYSVSGINENDVLKSKESRTIQVSIEYDSAVREDELPKVDQNLTLTATLNFIQAN